MTALWQDDGTGWRLVAPSGFKAENALHTLVERGPQMLPLSGAPRLVVVGREVSVGNGYADLIAIESTGRVAIIEVKLAQNAEARRAVVAQILAYAAYLRGLDVSQLESTVLGRHLLERGYECLAHAVQGNDQEGSFDRVAFDAELAESLAEGRFRLVLVLDHAPDELITLVGYLESITDHLTIDLVTISAYRINESEILVPQRVDPERLRSTPSLTTGIRGAGSARPQATLAVGAGDFAASIDHSPPAQQPDLRRLLDWAISLETDGLVTLSTVHGVSNRLTLLPRLPDENVGLVTIWNTQGHAELTMYRSVFSRRAPKALDELERLIAPTPVGQGNTLRTITDELLTLLSNAYREAARVGSAGGNP